MEVKETLEPHKGCQTRALDIEYRKFHEYKQRKVLKKLIIMIENFA